jgi:hypothetical protein
MAQSQGLPPSPPPVSHTVAPQSVGGAKSPRAGLVAYGLALACLAGLGAILYHYVNTSMRPLGPTSGAKFGTTVAALGVGAGVAVAGGRYLRTEQSAQGDLDRTRGQPASEPVGAAAAPSQTPAGGESQAELLVRLREGLEEAIQRALEAHSTETGRNAAYRNATQATPLTRDTFANPAELCRVLPELTAAGEKHLAPERGHKSYTSASIVTAMEHQASLIEIENGENATSRQLRDAVAAARKAGPGTFPRHPQISDPLVPTADGLRERLAKFLRLDLEAAVRSLQQTGVINLSYDAATESLAGYLSRVEQAVKDYRSDRLAAANRVLRNVEEARALMTRIEELGFIPSTSGPLQPRSR